MVEFFENKLEFIRLFIWHIIYIPMYVFVQTYSVFIIIYGYT